MTSQNKMAAAIWGTLIVSLYFRIGVLSKRLVCSAYNGRQCELCTNTILLYIYECLNGISFSN